MEITKIEDGKFEIKETFEKVSVLKISDLQQQIASLAANIDTLQIELQRRMALLTELQIKNDE